MCDGKNAIEMKLFLKHNDIEKQHLSITYNLMPCMDSSWHYHPQYELLYISCSTGIRFVGDSVSPFRAGDLALVGPYLPHLWRNEASYYQNYVQEKVGTVVIQFTKAFIGEEVFNKMEFVGVNAMLERSKYGIAFDRETVKRLHPLLMALPEMPPAAQLIKLMELLYELSLSDGQRQLSMADMRQYTTDNSKRLDGVLKFISDHYADSISLDKVSSVACMTSNSFCRFFKKMTNKSYTQYLNEVRIHNASRLLAQENMNVTEVCDTVGYKSITHFNRQFKQIMGQTPSQYLKEVEKG